MYTTKSFCNVSAIASNEPGVNSRVGELTTFASTYSKELGAYHSANFDGYDLYNFYSANDGVKQKMAFDLVDQAVALVNYLVQQTLATTGELYTDQLMNGINATANSVGAISVQLGPMDHDGDNWLPSWISWSNSNDNRPNVHKVWLSVQAFLLQYTDYEIVVVPPFDNLDDFFLPGSQVETKYKAITPAQMMERSELYRNNQPETVRRMDPYEYQDVANSARKFDVYWTVLVYGGAGDNPDLIRQALIDYILANSRKTRDEWAAIFPDIFRRTEYIFAPYWEQYAAGARQLLHGVYSPVVDAPQVISRLTNLLPDYSAAHIGNYCQLLGFPYRSIAVSVIGHWENKDNAYRITDRYGDYMNLPTDSTDFGRMSPNTQTWALQIYELVVMAENWNSSTDLPHGTAKVTRNTEIYLSRTIGRAQMLVLTKESALKRFPTNNRT